MANSINWGSVYAVSWWGDGAINNIGWGDVYEGYPVGQLYAARVTADGGTVESIYCAMQAIQDL